VDFFEQRIRPILVDHCYECHGPDDPSGQLRLDTRAGWTRGGESGPAIVPGDPEASLLYRAATHQDPKLKMPPLDTGEKLTDRQIRDLAMWIRQGAVDPRNGDAAPTPIETEAQDHWAFQPIAPPEVDETRHPIDDLIERRLPEVGFEVTGPSEHGALIRRATYDLHGLPPTAEQLETEPDQFPELIDQLLASPRYGERWGRHWLDVARYSDAKDGVLMYGDARIRPFAYTYRDYIIRAFNDDKPFDQFIREQIAADQLELPSSSPRLAAMGLLTLGRMFDNNPHDVIDDQIDVITRGFLGLTVSCARCHDHKFDPIPTADYYSLYGVFASSIEPYDRSRIESVSEAGQAYEEEIQTKLEEVYSVRQTHYDETLATARARTIDYLVQVATTEPDISETTIFFLSLLPEQLRPQITYRWRKLIARRAHPNDPIFGPWHDLMLEPKLQIERWVELGVDQRIIDAIVGADPKTPEQVARAYGAALHTAWKNARNSREAGAETQITARDNDSLVELLTSEDSPTWFPIHEIYHHLSRKQKDAFRGLVNELDAISVKHPGAAARAMLMVDSATLFDPVIFQRGDPSQPGTAVPRRFLQICSTKERLPFPGGSGRLALAQAIAADENPLTARVWVNRIWMHHFGKPLVDDPSDFGLRTVRPLQYELLDYLADAFIDDGWQTKPLHKLIMTSKAYQRSSRIEATPGMASQLERDPNNRYIWHGNRRRLDLEQMRDTMLCVSGKINFTMYGRPPSITDLNNHRRTIYAFVERQNLPSIIQTFDFANADTSTAKRVTTIVPQQALFAMNSPFVMQSAAALAERTAGDFVANRIRRMYEITLGRLPNAEEAEMGRKYVETNPWERYAQILLMTNELMFVD
jgi:hypothetical protein